MNNTFYFSHDGNARNDPKILELRVCYGWEGYGIFWMLIERMFEDSETKIDYQFLKSICFCERIESDLLSKVISLCVEKGLFETDADSFWSNGLRDRKDSVLSAIKQRSDAGKKGMASRWNKPQELPEKITEDITSYNDDITKNNKQINKRNKHILSCRETTKEIIDYLNLKAGTSFKDGTASTQSHINARLTEGFSVDDFKTVIDIKCDEWKDDIKYSKYLRPDTLFNTKFDGYLNQAALSRDRGGAKQLSSGGIQL